MTYYYHFRSLNEAVLVNPRPTSTTSYYKQHYSVDNLKIYIQHNLDTSISDIVTPLCNDNKNILSVTTEKKFDNPDQAITINKNQERKEGLETHRVYSSDKPNTMGYHRNKSLYSDRYRNKTSKPDHTENISLVNPEYTFSCYSQIIATNRNPGRRVSIDYDSNIIVP